MRRLSTSAWLRPRELLGSREAKKFDDVCARYRSYCHNHHVPPFDRNSAAAYLQDGCRTAGRWRLQIELRQLRRYFLDSGRPDPFGSPAQLVSALQMCAARPALERRVYPTNTYHRLIDSLPAGAIGSRDGAMIGLIYTGRVSGVELEQLDCEHVTFCQSGLRAELVASPKRAPLILRRYPNPTYCPVALLECWLRTIDFSGPAFRAISSRGGHVYETRMAYRSIIWSVRRRLLAIGEPDGSLVSLKGTMIAVASMRDVSDSAIRAQAGLRTNDTIEKWKKRGRVGLSNLTQRLGF